MFNSFTSSDLFFKTEATLGAPPIFLGIELRKCNAKSFCFGHRFLSKEAVGFEPTAVLPTTVFKTDGITHSPTPPQCTRLDSNQQQCGPEPHACFRVGLRVRNGDPGTRTLNIQILNLAPAASWARPPHTGERIRTSNILVLSEAPASNWATPAKRRGRDSNSQQRIGCYGFPGRCHTIRRPLHSGGPGIRTQTVTPLKRVPATRLG